MTTEHKEEAGPVTVHIGVCSVCHALFLMSGDRLTSPCHGADPLTVLATLTIGPDAQVTGEWGFGAPIGERDITEEPAPAPAPPAEPPAEEEEEQGEEPQGTPHDLLMWTVDQYFQEDVCNAEDVRRAFEVAGAEPEAAATAVGRLSAVRELIRTLRTPEEPAPVAPAPPEAESSPQNS